MLPPETEKLWNFLQTQPGLAGFVLIGGSALALRIRHRVSEDLDLVFPHPRLPRERLDALRRSAREAGFDFEANDNLAALQEFAAGGGDLHDYQQDFRVNGAVKLSFFAPEPPLTRVLAASPEGTVRIASLPELFKTKCLVSAVRSKTRDWLDLYLLLRDHGFTLRDYRTAFVEADAESQCDTGLTRLCSGSPQRDDEGYAHLLPQPPTLKEMTDYFIAQRNELEVELAAEARRRHNGNV